MTCYVTMAGAPRLALGLVKTSDRSAVRGWVETSRPAYSRPSLFATEEQAAQAAEAVMARDGQAADYSIHTIRRGHA